MRAVIIGGAPISDYSFVRSELDAGDFFVLCDSGLCHVAPLGIAPDLIVGDFDSHKRPDTDTETIVLPREKDDTDTVFAAKECIKRGFDEFLIIGAVGARLDHTLANVYLLTMLENLGFDAHIVDDYSKMCIVSDKRPRTVDSGYGYFSLVNIDGSARDITVRGAKYNLENAQIPTEYQYGVSNEVAGDFASISLGQGKLLLIKVKNY